ncbi:MAG TPA: Spx/MgsR family RNA polymerase-binding regulatory protein [Kofleriaceae bacterium]|nr:Spx/MgsR family RNA polymerase-binding regulatory protein [Kofleriaceae bacterium]
MALVVYHYPNCSTCKKALAWLRAHDIAFDAVDIVKQPPSKTALERAARLAGVATRKMFNVSGEAYRAGNFKERLADMTDAQAFAALAADGKLIKRPLALGDGVALVGFDEAAWQAKLG